MVEKILSRSVRLMFVGGVVMSASLLAQQALAQEAVQRVEITGSSIKRIAVEGALPVQTLSKAQIEQTGASTVADLVASLPSMQGFVTASTSINGGGGGVQTASVHAIGTDYTLVLLNGRRIAPYSTGSAVNLSSIPLSAVERVEILTDGASALYGSDAIAGVVNFILKKNQQDFVAELTYSTPEKSSKGATTNFSLSKGFGDLSKDGYNVLLAYSHDTQKELNASDRSFSKSGVVPFSNNGKSLSLYQTSINSIPANVNVSGAGLPDGEDISFNPSLINTGVCSAANTFKVGQVCRYNYAATVELLPEMKRDGFFASANFKINENTTFFAEGLYSKFTSTARFAPPAQPLSVDINSALYKNNIVPALIKMGVDPTQVTSSDMNLRLVDAGGRTDGWETEAKHIAFGVEGTFKNVDYNISYTHSENKSTDNAVAGYTSGDKLDALIAASTYNPFVPPDAATKAAILPAVLHQVLDVSTSKLDVLTLRGSTEVFQAGGGGAQLGLGVDMTKQSYIDNPSAIAQGPNSLQPNWTDTNVGGGTGALPFDTSRKSWGTFAELLVPVMKNLDITGAVRYDSYAAAQNAKGFNSTTGALIGSVTQGNTQSAATYKLAAAFRPVDNVLLRASYGTGFKAPSLGNITAPLTNGGSSNNYACPITSGPLLPLCKGTAEYGLLSGGNSATGEKGLKAEKSQQYTLGFRVEPVKNVSIGIDLWDVKLKDQIATLPQNVVFGKPEIYGNLFSSYYDPIQKQNVLVAALTPLNLAASHYQGIDWDASFGTSTSYGKIGVNLTGTYMLKATQSLPGSDDVQSVGRFDEYNSVTFRTIAKSTLNWKPSAMYNHGLTWNFHSGYHDAPITAKQRAVREVNADGTLGAYVASVRDVDAYSTIDWQTKVTINKMFSITGGIRNLLNIDPPFSQRINGGGNQLGYDGRYTDPLGRQYYLVGNVKY